ncbi:hypothetical protein CVT26_015439 [Gymnopilus dilepis]|uniref:Uncharacterized protein n=1 Tax=Gymnopilus dilepis TaxID=231916 RepID=A0A409YEJ7_9AGAR|nr:hypothetical protein CVT26_015439 [Gymnopilus dilepis]
MSTPSRPPASEAPRQFTVPLPLEFDPQNYFPGPEFASSASHLALGCKNSVLVYSLPAFDLVDTIKPGNLTRGLPGPLHIHDRYLVIPCESEHSVGSEDFEERCLLYIWDLSTRKHIGSVICSIDFIISVSLPSAKTSEEGELEGTIPGWHQDPALVVASPAEGRNGDNLATYVLNHPDAEKIEGSIERTRKPLRGFRGLGHKQNGVTQGHLLLRPATTICSIHTVYCLVSMGRTALTGGRDRTVRAWDITTGKCQMVFIGHTAPVIRLRLDEERIYSASGDCTIRVWDRYQGDCSHVVELKHSRLEMHSLDICVTSPYLIVSSTSYYRYDFRDSPVFIFNIISGKFEQTINGQWRCNLGPIRGTEPTLATIGLAANQHLPCFKILDLRSGRFVTSSLFEPGFLAKQWFIQGRFFMGITGENKGHILKVWDFDANESLDTEVMLGNDGHRRSRDDVTYNLKPGEANKDDQRKAMAPSASSSVIEGGSSANSKTTEKRKRSSIRCQNSPRRKRGKSTNC